MSVEIRKKGDQLMFGVDGTPIGQVDDPGLFASGRLHFGANIAPGNQLTIETLAVQMDTPSGFIPLTPDSPFSLRVPLDGASAPSLRSLGATRGLLMGAAVRPGPLRNDVRYRELLAREFSVLTPENALKFGPAHPEADRYDFCDADTIMEFAEANGQKIHGHTLVWHLSLPAWITERAYSRDELLAIMRDHIHSVVGRYRGRVVAWDVVNEAVARDGSLRDTLWLRGIGPEYIELAFRWAREADPDALLFYNEFDAEGLGRKADAVYQLVTDLKRRGVPIDGVGLQSHYWCDRGTCTLPSEGAAPSAADLAANLNRLAAAGLQVQITEVDVALRLPAGAADLATQVDMYRRVLAACTGQAACTAFIAWGADDGHSSINANSFRPGFGAGLLFDVEYRPKPAYDALISFLRGN